MALALHGIAKPADAITLVEKPEDAPAIKAKYGRVMFLCTGDAERWEIARHLKSHVKVKDTLLCPLSDYSQAFSDSLLHGNVFQVGM